MLFGMKLPSCLQHHVLGSLRIWNTVISAQNPADGPEPDAVLDAGVHPTCCVRFCLLWESSEHQALHNCLLAAAQKRAACNSTFTSKKKDLQSPYYLRVISHPAQGPLSLFGWIHLSTAAALNASLLLYSHVPHCHLTI